MVLSMPRQVLATLPKKRPTALERLACTRFGRLLERVGLAQRAADSEGLLELAGALLSLRGRASGQSLASAFFALYEASPEEARAAFLAQFHAAYPRDAAAIDRAVAQWGQRRDDTAALALQEAAESPCSKLIRQLNLAPRGTRRLIAMRADLLDVPDRSDGLRAFDAEFEGMFETWFNAGFLELRPIEWTSPALLLEHIIRYEAVHSIQGWDDLRRRVQPADRRCYGFFHPQMPDDPLIFVEVALTQGLPSAIHQIIAEERAEIDPHSAGSAIFYSISNCQKGLRGIPFGNFLIKRVVELLRSELPQLSTFATLSPVPGLVRWLGDEQPDGETLREAAARYLVSARDAKGQVRDSVARFHLGNGARLEAVHADADRSDNGLAQSRGIMVNYVYDLAEIEANLFALVEMGTVSASAAVQELVAGKAEAPRKGRKAG